MDNRKKMETASNTDPRDNSITGLGSSTSTAAPPTSATQQNVNPGSVGTTPGDVDHSAGASLGEKVKGIAHQGHGVGESLRGNINAAVDSMSGDRAGQAKNENIIHQGEQEFRHGDAVSKDRPIR